MQRTATSFDSVGHVLFVNVAGGGAFSPEFLPPRAGRNLPKRKKNTAWETATVVPGVVTRGHSAGDELARRVRT